MPEINANLRIERPAEGFSTTRLPCFADRPIRTYMPTDYQPLYHYPLIVLIHGTCGNEEQISRLAPRLSRRNYIAISLRGTQSTGRRDDGRLIYSWDCATDENNQTTEYLLAAVEHTQRSYNIHAKQIFLVGVSEGAEVAYRVGFGIADRIGGIVGINGSIPQSSGFAPKDLNSVHRLPVLIAHGTANPIVPLSTAKKDYRLLATAGAEVRFASYPTTHRIHPNMLRDVNRWIIARVMANKASIR